MKATSRANGTGLNKALNSSMSSIKSKMVAAHNKVVNKYTKIASKNSTGKLTAAQEVKYDTETRKKQVDVLHSWYKTNASKYGYTYSFTKN